jgi:hypothetical protein
MNFLKTGKGKHLRQFTKYFSTFLPKKLSLKNMDLESEIRGPEKTYAESRIQGSKSHRIPDPDP